MMNTEMMKQLAEQNVEAAVKNIEMVEGSSNAEEIIDNLQTGMRKVQILKNDRFELIYNKKQNKVEFNTTFSNQKIDESYIKELNMINQSKDQIEEKINEFISI